MKREMGRERRRKSESEYIFINLNLIRKSEKERTIE